MGDDRQAAEAEDREREGSAAPGPAGGSATTEEQLTADNAAEEETIEALHDGSPSE